MDFERKRVFKVGAEEGEQIGEVAQVRAAGPSLSPFARLTSPPCCLHSSSVPFSNRVRIPPLNQASASDSAICTLPAVGKAVNFQMRKL